MAAEAREGILLFKTQIEAGLLNCVAAKTNYVVNGKNSRRPLNHWKNALRDLVITV